MRSFRSRSALAATPETFFESLSDLLIGLIFVFLIILMSYALNLRVAEEQQRHAEALHKKTVRQLSDAGLLRGKLLRKIQVGMRKNHLQVSIDERNGIVRVPENLVFDSGSALLTGKGRDALHILAGQLLQTLPCYSATAHRPRSCSPDSHSIIDAVFIEGHTDTVPVNPGGQFKNNWELSSARSHETYSTLVGAEKGLTRLKNANGQPLLSISAYGETRPVTTYRSPAENRRHSRRIDIRFVIGTPRV